MNSVAFDVMTFLNDNAIGTTGTDLFCFEWGHASQEEIDKQVLVLDQEAVDSPLKNTYEQPVIQVLVRGSKRESGKTVYARARAIFNLLIAQSTVTINGTDYLEFEPLSNVTPIGRDANNRFMVSLNFYTFRNPT